MVNNITNMIKTLKFSSPRLQEVKLEAACYNTQGRSTLSLKKWGLDKLYYLQSLTLNLSRYAFIDNENQPEGKLNFSVVKRLKKLKSLNITFFDRYQDTRLAVSSELVFDPNKISPNLKRFKWGIVSRCSNKTSGIELFGSEIAMRLSSLEDFGLRIQANGEKNGRGVKETAHCLTGLKTNLNQFSRRSHPEILTSHVANALLKAFSGARLQAMHTLSLDFVECKGISQGFLAKLVQIISRNMMELRSFRLRFDFSKEVSGGLRRTLMDTFAASENLIDKEISKFGANLSEGCQKLELLLLDFADYAKISDKGVESLCDSLSEVRLRFRFCHEVSSASLDYAKKKLGAQREVSFVFI